MAVVDGFRPLGDEGVETEADESALQWTVDAASPQRMLVGTPISARGSALGGGPQRADSYRRSRSTRSDGGTDEVLPVRKSESGLQIPDPVILQQEAENEVAKIGNQVFSKINALKNVLQRSETCLITSFLSATGTQVKSTRQELEDVLNTLSERQHARTGDELKKYRDDLTAIIDRMKARVSRTAPLTDTEQLTASAVEEQAQMLRGIDRMMNLKELRAKQAATLERIRKHEQQMSLYLDAGPSEDSASPLQTPAFITSSPPPASLGASQESLDLSGVPQYPLSASPQSELPLSQPVSFDRMPSGINPPNSVKAGNETVENEILYAHLDKDAEEVDTLSLKSPFHYPPQPSSPPVATSPLAPPVLSPQHLHPPVSHQVSHQSKNISDLFPGEPDEFDSLFV